MSDAIRCYRDLKVWRAGMDLAHECYRLTQLFPKAELYGLSAQIRRAAVSVPSNIAEGHGRLHRGDYVRHLSIASGSVAELESELAIARRLGYLTASDDELAVRMADEVGKMLGSLIRKLRQNPSP